MCPARVSNKSVLPECVRVLRENVFSECATRVCHKSVRQECLTGVSHKSVPHECYTRVCHKSVTQECPTRLSGKTVKQECFARVAFNAIEHLLFAFHGSVRPRTLLLHQILQNTFGFVASIRSVSERRALKKRMTSLSLFSGLETIPKRCGGIEPNSGMF